LATATTTFPPAEAGLRSGTRFYYVLFFFSGFPALLYQIVCQRALFTIYGVNIESVTVIVTVFMLGLGLGSLAGGWLSKRPKIPLLGVFGAIELGIGLLGAISLNVFHAVASFTAGVSAFQTGLVTFSLLFVPTLLMGSTLPLLVAHLVSRNGNIGESVGALYSVNTMGSAVACFLAANFLMRWLGESGCVHAAALVNGSVAAAAFALQLRNARRGSTSAARITTAGGGIQLLHFIGRYCWLRRSASSHWGTRSSGIEYTPLSREELHLPLPRFWSGI
jgi:spermidine synthase